MSGRHDTIVIKDGRGGQLGAKGRPASIIAIAIAIVITKIGPVVIKGISDWLEFLGRKLEGYVNKKAQQAKIES